jgi:ketol-acid reductoisomerase
MLFLDEWRSHDMKQPIIMKKKIGILGSGNVGKVLASGFIAHGYNVMIGIRDTTQTKRMENCIERTRRLF